MEKEKKVIFFHMNQLGDLLFSLPVIAAARKQWPEKKLVSLVRQKYVSFMNALGLVDEVIPRPHKGLKEKLELLRKLKNARYDEAVFFSESPEALMLGFFANIPRRIGFKTASLGILLTEKAERDGVPSLRNNARLGKDWGLKNINKDYCGLVNIDDSRLEELESGVITIKNARKKTVILAPGASRKRKQKCWQNRKWSELITVLNKHGLLPVLIGSHDESAELKKIIKKSKSFAVLFTAHQGFLSLSMLLKRTDVYVGIDSGPMHLAAALGVPVVALFGPTDPAQVGPRPLEKHAVIKRKKMSQIEVKEVWKAISSKI